MKTLRYRIGNEVIPGILDADENIRDASSLVKDWDNETVTVENLSSIMNKDLSVLGIANFNLSPICNFNSFANASIPEAIVLSEYWGNIGITSNFVAPTPFFKSSSQLS